MTEKDESCDDVLTDFINWFKSIAEVKQYDPMTCEITLPMRDPSNDLIRVLIKQLDTGKIILSDMGLSFGYLHLNGINPGIKRQAQLNRLLTKQLGLKISGDEIVKLVSNPQELNLAILNIADGIRSIKSYKNIKKSMTVFNSTFTSEVNTTFHKWGLQPLINQNFISANKKMHRVDFVFDSGISLDTISAHGKSVATSRLDRELLKAVDFKSTFREVERPEKQLVVVLDDRVDMDYWDPWRISLLNSVEAMTLYWNDNRYELGELLGVKVDTIDKELTDSEIEELL